MRTLMVALQHRFLQKQYVLNVLLLWFVIMLLLMCGSGVTATTKQSALSNASALFSAQGYADGQTPFLTQKPFIETYQRPVWINSFFDHKLPGYGSVELNTRIPSDLRDSEGLTNFIGTRLPDLKNVNCTFGVNCYSGHDGIDYNTMTDAVIAPANGIIRVGSESSNCRVWIEHDASVPSDNTYDFSSLYLHMSAIGLAAEDQLIRPGRPNLSTWVAGDRIRAGERIGQSGDVDCGGSADGNHLHFGVAEGTVSDQRNPRIFDPYGWWSNSADPWTDPRLETILASNSWQPARSRWVWAAPQAPAAGQPGAWDERVVAQTDDRDVSFERFGPVTRRLTSIGWHALLMNEAASIRPMGIGAWLSTSLVDDADQTKRNSAVWGLHIPADGQYRIQAFTPRLPAGHTATATARYTIYIPTSDTELQIGDSAAVDQRTGDTWHDLIRSDGEAVYTLGAGTVVLVRLSDVTGVAGETVIFDAIRVRAEGSVQPSPPPPIVGRVGFAIDNSSSMIGLGKIGAVKEAIPPWIDQLTAAGVRYTYALIPFANNVPPASVTNDPDQIKASIAALSGNDNGVGNYECPEESLGAIAQLASEVKSGHMLLFTDDLPFSPLTKTAPTLGTLLLNNIKFHAIILPKTCGSTGPEGWLPYRLLALTTGGTYQTVEPARTSAALQIVLSEMRADTQLSVGVNTASIAPALQSTSVVTHPVVVDDTITQLNVLINIIDGTATLNLIRPDGTIVSSSDPGVTFVDSGSAQYYQISVPAVGNWQGVVSATGEYHFSTSASSTLQYAYLGQTRSAPNQIIELAARLTGPISTATFSLETTEGQHVADVELRDDGTQSDLVANDGLYTGYYVPTQVGDLRLRVIGTTTTGTTFSRVDTRLIRVLGLGIVAPEARTLANGETAEVTFTLTNYESVARTYTLNATSNNNWIIRGPGSTVILQPGASVPVIVMVEVPTTAPENSIDKIRLTATSQADATVIVEKTVTIFTLLPIEPAPEVYNIMLPMIRR